MTRIPRLAAAVTLFISGTAAAQAAQRDWSPFEKEPSCLVSQNYFAKPDAKNRLASAQGLILQWYVWGKAFATHVAGSDLKAFSECFQSFDGAPDCGLPKDPAIADALWSAYNGKKILPGDAADRYFAEPPPPAAIRYAARAVGRCFGKDSASFSLTDLGLVEIDTPVPVCLAAVYKAQSPFTNKPPHEITREFAQRPEVQAWATVVSNLIGFNAVVPAKPVEACRLAPASLAGILGGAAMQAKADSARADTAAEAERVRLSNRTDEERYRGLNGCQIAYSLVFQGINSKAGIVGKVPDRAIGWALDYEKASLGAGDCPPMPEVLSRWVQQQPMETFQAEPDPYAAFRLRRAPTFEKTHASWRSFAETWMSRYDTEKAASGPADSDCAAALRYARSPAMGPVLNADNGPSAFQTLARLDYSNEASAAFCEFVPTAMMSAARQARDAKAFRDAEAREKARRAEAVVPASLPKQDYLWKRAPTTRCYWAGETRQGQREVCFTN